ncbi:nicotinamide riboside kinase 2 isoform X2 [Planococcus citri]|uniref:nicotinamide riboside kinase 2 isoform X2 n=1 Tax=Planococcus citri TaxID=170843 RepID=UPI0031F744FC
MSSWIVVGFGGVTCGGKTTISNELHKMIPNSVIIHQDDYFHPMGSEVLEYIEEVQHYNWDTVTAIDSERMINDVKQIISSDVSGSPRVLIVEGHFIYDFPTIGDRCDYKFLVKSDKETCRYRRRTRKYKRYDQRYFDEYAWPATEHHYKHALETYKDTVIELDGLSPVSQNLQIILQRLNLA